MILKQLLSSQASSLTKRFKKRHNEIWDIVAYGSAVRGKISARDVDIAIILTHKINLGQKLELAQELKHSLKKLLLFEADVKAIDLQDLLDPLFAARKAILAEGFSLIKKKRLAELFGFSPFYIFTYSLKGLSHSRKIMFRYALRGRRGQKGLLEINKCEQLGRGVIKVPLEHSEELKSFFEKQKIRYNAHACLFY